MEAPSWTPFCNVGSLSCFCTCDPARGQKPAIVVRKGDVVFEYPEEMQELRVKKVVERKGRALGAKQGNSIADPAVEEDTPIARPMAPYGTGLTIDDILSPSNLSDLSTLISPTATLPTGGSAATIPVVPPLGPVGSGGWHMEEDVTEEMRQVASLAVEMYAQREKKCLTEFNEKFLTSVTLANYVRPISAKHLTNALIGRACNEDLRWLPRVALLEPEASDRFGFPGRGPVASTVEGGFVGGYAALFSGHPQHIPHVHQGQHERQDPVRFGQGGGGRRIGENGLRRGDARDGPAIFGCEAQSIRKAGVPSDHRLFFLQGKACRLRPVAG